VVDAKDASHGIRGRPIVPGEHHDSNALGVQRTDRFACTVLDRISDSQEARYPRIDGNEHDRLPGFSKFVGSSLQRFDAGRERLHHLGVADGDAMALDRPDDALVRPVPSRHVPRPSAPR
jgi:hypothetical protein